MPKNNNQIAKEIRRLTKTIAVIGQALFEDKIAKTKQKQSQIKELTQAMAQQSKRTTKSVVPKEKDQWTRKNIA